MEYRPKPLQFLFTSQLKINSWCPYKHAIKKQKYSWKIIMMHELEIEMVFEAFRVRQRCLESIAVAWAWKVYHYSFL